MPSSNLKSRIIDQTLTVLKNNGEVSVEIFEGREGGNLSDGDQGTLVIDNIEDGEEVVLYKVILALSSGQPAPTGMDMIIATLDNAGGFTRRKTVLAGDGATVYDRETGEPYATWENNTGTDQTVAVLIDNQSGSIEDIYTLAEGLTVR